MTPQKKKKNTNSEPPIVAIDLGTTAVRAMAARKQQDGTLQILGLKRIAIRPDKVFKERGIISNASEAHVHIRNVLMELGEEIGMQEQLLSTFVTIEGKGMQVVTVSKKTNQINKKPISAALLEEMEQKCIEMIEDKNPEYTVVSIEPQSFILDDTEQTDIPDEGQAAQWVEGRYTATVCKKIAAEKLQGSFDRAIMIIENKWATSDALVTALTNEDDSEEGCAIINFGAQTTTLVIYKNSQILKVKTIPLGGYHITNDITAMNISFANAEKCKTIYGKASEKQITHSQTLAIPSTKTDEKVKLSTTFLANIIQMRLYEIVHPIMKEINDCSDIIGKVYVSGGGAMLEGLTDYLQELTSLPVEFGTHSDWLSEDEHETEYFKPEYSILIGTLALGADYREKHKKATLPPPPFPQKIKNKVETFVIDLFQQQQ